MLFHISTMTHYDSFEATSIKSQNLAGGQIPGNPHYFPQIVGKTLLITLWNYSISIKTDNPIPWCLLHSYMAHTLYMECVSPWIIFHLNKTKQKTATKYVPPENQRVNHLGKVWNPYHRSFAGYFPFAPPVHSISWQSTVLSGGWSWPSTNGLPCPLSVECGQIKSIAKRSESETIMLISLFLSLFLPLQLGCLSTELSICHEVALKGTRLPIF